MTERSRFGMVADLEHRPDHNGGVSSIVHPNGSLICTSDYALDNVFLNAIYHLHTERGDA